MDDDEGAGGRVASFHLVRERPGRGALALARLAADRPRLARTPGLVFSRLLGTGRGDDTGPSVDTRRTALLAVWATGADLDRFLAGSPLAERWIGAEEAWHVRLRVIGGHGAWRGFDVLGGLHRGADTGPIAVLTRAAVRTGSWPAFRRAGHDVSAEVRAAVGMLAVVGVGEAPIGRLGTFSLWRDLDAMRRFATAAPHHRDAVRRTRRERWYREELFARFEPYASAGTWDGRDPLAGDRRDTTGSSMP